MTVIDRYLLLRRRKPAPDLDAWREAQLRAAFAGHGTKRRRIAHLRSITTAILEARFAQRS